jgi:putative tricarboxylic transport membrane protein
MHCLEKRNSGNVVIANRLSALFWLLLGVSALFGSIIIGLGTVREPGSGFLPFIASITISVFALIILIQSWGKDKENNRTLASLWRGLRWKRPLAVCIITAGYILFFEILGFAIATFLFLMTLLRGMESIAWWKALLLSGFATSLSYLLLSFSLESTIPKGILGF